MDFSYDKVNVSWHEYLNSIQFQQNNNTIILKLGDCIIYKSRELPVRIDRFIGDDEAGPMGFEFLPWRGDRWATLAFGLRGNPRFIICPPVGLSHYGQHIDWDTIEIVPSPIKTII
jgi:hypothetical protein